MEISLFSLDFHTTPKTLWHLSQILSKHSEIMHTFLFIMMHILSIHHYSDYSIFIMHTFAILWLYDAKSQILYYTNSTNSTNTTLLKIPFATFRKSYLNIAKLCILFYLSRSIYYQYIIHTSLLLFIIIHYMHIFAILWLLVALTIFIQ